MTSFQIIGHFVLSGPVAASDADNARHFKPRTFSGAVRWQGSRASGLLRETVDPARQTGRRTHRSMQQRPAGSVSDGKMKPADAVCRDSIQIRAYRQLPVRLPPRLVSEDRPKPSMTNRRILVSAGCSKDWITLLFSGNLYYMIPWKTRLLPLD